MRARDNRQAALAALRGNWGISIVVSLVGAILGGSLMGNNATNSSASASSSNLANTDNVLDALPPVVWSFVAGILGAIAFLLAIYALVVLVIGGAVNLGLKQYYISLNTKEQPARFGILFSRFGIFGKAFLLQLVTGVFIFLWTLLLIIPGIVASYRYAMAPYIMARHPEVGVMEAISLSKQMMAGHKWRLFCLQLSFIGWIFLCALTLGIGFLWLAPYISAAEANFYLTLPRVAQPQPAAPPAPQA